MPLPFSRRATQTAPSFSRDFAGLKTLDHGVGPAITFTRASNATFFDANGTLQTASNDTPRFDHDPATGASRGLLIEESRTNLLERSAEFDNAYWTKTNSTASANNTTAPDGTQSAEQLVENNLNGVHDFRRIVTSLSASTAYTASVFVKAGTRTRGELQMFGNSGGSTVTFNLSAQTATATGAYGGWSATSASITNVGSGWFRITNTATTNTGLTQLSVSIAAADASGNGSYTGDGTSGLYIWGAQLEAGSFPTSYIPTTNAAATRAADSAVVTPISSFYNQSEGTLFGEARLARQATGFTPILFIGSFGNNVDIRYRSTGVTGFDVSAASAVQAGFFGESAISANAIAKVIGAYKANDFAFSQNGGAAQSDSSGTLPNPTQLHVGSDGGTFFNGHIRKIAYWPRRLSNSLLQQITT